MFGNSDIKHQLSRLIRIGEVSSVDFVKGTARVVFDDYDGMVSGDLPVLQFNTIGNQDYHMPDIGEDVLCLFLPNGTVEGFIIGSFYAGEIIPPETTGEKRTVVFLDGTRFSYDRTTRQFDIEIDQTKITATAEGVTVTAPTITFNGDVVVNGTLTATADVVGGGVSLNSHIHGNGNNGADTSEPR